MRPTPRSKASSNRRDLASVDQAERREDKKGAFYVALIEKPGRATAEVVAEIVPGHRARFPLAEIHALGHRASFAGCGRSIPSFACSTARSSPFEIDGIKSGKETRGHRFMAPRALRREGLRRLCEEAPRRQSHPRRRGARPLILDGARALAKKEKLTLVEDEASACRECRSHRMAGGADGHFRRGIPGGAAGSARHRHEGAPEMLLRSARGRSSPTGSY